MDTKIISILNRKDEKFLRVKTALFDFRKFSKKNISDLIKKMREVMDEAEGVGLAANQIGLNLSVFIARVEGKFYSIFNPEIVKKSEETVGLEEGCLSIPGKRGEAFRSDKITLLGSDKNGKRVKIKAWGLLARVFQHEVDHLNGKLFIDRLKK